MTILQSQVFQIIFTIVVADIGSQVIILSYLERFPNSHILAEEDSKIFEKIDTNKIENIISMISPLVADRFKGQLDIYKVGSTLRILIQL